METPDKSPSAGCCVVFFAITHTHAHTHAHTHTRTHARTHARTRTHTHTHQSDARERKAGIKKTVLQSSRVCFSYTLYASGSDNYTLPSFHLCHTTNRSSFPFFPAPTENGHLPVSFRGLDVTRCGRDERTGGSCSLVCVLSKFSGHGRGCQLDISVRPSLIYNEV